MKLRELATTFPTQMLKYPRGTDTLRHATARPRDRNVPATVVVFAGNTGSGKTWRAHTELEARFGPDGYYVCEGMRSAARRNFGLNSFRTSTRLTQTCWGFADAHRLRLPHCLPCP